MNFVFFFGFLVFYLSPATFANDASFHGDGATVYTTKEHRVRMVRENIEITYNEKDPNSLRWKADCTFEFENLTDQKIQLTMGFPNWKGFGDAVDRNEFVIKDFKTWIEDKEIKTEIKNIDRKNQTGPWVQKKKLATFEGAFVWPVDFAPKGKVIVKNKFSFGGFSSNGPFDVLEHMPPTYPKIKKEHTFWSAQKPKKSDIDFANALVGAVAYITTTGLTWSGPIGEAKISIQIPSRLQKTPHFLVPLPQGYHLKKDKVVWEFKNYVPKSEIALYFLANVVLSFEDEGSQEPPMGFQYLSQAKAWIKFNRASKVDPEIIDKIIEITPKSEIKKYLESQKAKN